MPALLTSADLIAPKGEIEIHFFPSRSQQQLEADLSQWATEGLEKAAGLATDALKKDAATAWAYYRAYGSIYRRINALPSSINTSQGGHSYTAAQIESFRVAMNDNLAAFNNLIAATAPPKRGLPNPIAARTLIIP